VLAQTADKLETVHLRHDDVGDDQMGALGFREGKSLRPVGSFEELMTFIAQESYQVLPGGGPVINDQDGRHSQFISDFQ
jgi:hypothetical protein